jgi:hypothetical protein
MTLLWYIAFCDNVSNKAWVSTNTKPHTYNRHAKPNNFHDISMRIQTQH